MLTVLKIWAIVNVIGIAIATAKGIYDDLTKGEDESEER